MAWDKEEEKRLRQVIKDSGVALLAENLVQGTWGNTAVRLDDDHMLVTPTGLDYVALQPEDMPIVQISDPSVWSDGKKPTSERKIHAAIMAARPEINATIHSHPVWCSVFASARVELPVMSDEMQKLVGGSARVGAYGLPGTKKLRNGTVGHRRRDAGPQRLLYGKPRRVLRGQGYGRGVRDHPYHGAQLQAVHRAKDARSDRSKDLQRRAALRLLQVEIWRLTGFRRASARR